MAGTAPRFLIIRRDNIGDLACTTPLLAGLRAQHPQAWIGVLANTYNAEVLARNPAPDAVYVYEKLKHRESHLLQFIRDRLRLLADLRGRRLDCVLVPAPAPQSLRFARGLRPARILASDPADLRHEVARTFALGAALGVTGAPGALRVFPDPARVQVLRARLPAGRRVAVHISARRPAQRWPLAQYAALIRSLGAHQRVTLLWSPGSRDDARHPGDDESAQALSHEPGVDAVPTPDLATLIAALSLADSVICPDGGAMHLAAALGKPVVALFGDSPAARWHPWGVPHRVLQPASRTLADLEADTVAAAHAELLAAQAAPA
ncbi:MAG: glycosyltransferase family 9 protein [Burkholderiales bacterium]